MKLLKNMWHLIGQLLTAFTMRRVADVEYVGMVGMYRVYQSNSIVRTYSLFAQDVPVACACVARGLFKKPVVVVNTALLNAPKTLRDSFIFHEIGHIVLKHLETQEVLDGQRVLTHELEADAFAQDMGHDMVEALTTLLPWEGVDLEEINLRISTLQSTQPRDC